MHYIEPVVTQFCILVQNDLDCTIFFFIFSIYHSKTTHLETANSLYSNQNNIENILLDLID